MKHPALRKDLGHGRNSSHALNETETEIAYLCLMLSEINSYYSFCLLLWPNRKFQIPLFTPANQSMTTTRLMGTTALTAGVVRRLAWRPAVLASCLLKRKVGESSEALEDSSTKGSGIFRNHMFNHTILYAKLIEPVLMIILQGVTSIKDTTSCASQIFHQLEYPWSMQTLVFGPKEHRRE